jgi:serine/threonine protein kinase
MASVQQVRTQLVEGELLEADRAEAEVARWRETSGGGDENGGAFVDWLVSETLLTEFQGDAIKAGHTGPFMLGPYRVFGRISLGRLGNLYHAEHAELAQPVSLKVFAADLEDKPEELARMQREARANVELDHPNIVRTFQIGRAGKVYFLAFDNLRGETLAERLERDGGLPYKEACRIVRDAARALAHLHEHVMVHRDVCPENIFLTLAGRVKLMELGAVRIVMEDPSIDDEVTTDDTVIGDYAYMAPEQARDPHGADHRADIYSLGCVLYHTLTGSKPFTATNPVKLVMEHATMLPPALSETAPDAPEQIGEIIDAALAKPPEDRYQKMDDLIWALDQHVDAEQEPPEEEDEVRDGFLSWLQSPDAHIEQPVTASPTPDLLDFVGWLAERHPDAK